MRRLRALPALLLALGAATHCSRRTGAVPSAWKGSPVVLISVDTLRADHLPFYGYGRLETPALTALRGDSVLFEAAWSQAPLTLPSHVALMTGAGASVHGVLDNSGYALSPAVPTLAEVMKANGYETGAAVSSVVLEGRTGISRGFDLWDETFGPPAPGQPRSQVQRPGSETAAILSRWVAGRGGKPFLAFLHVFEPHSPYTPPEPFRSRWASPYDGEIATADAAVGEFLGKLKAAGLYDGSLVVFLSDHGEGLGDHGEREHGIFLYREAIRVPLLIKLPGGALAGGTVATPVGLTDVFRTVCDAVALEGCPVRAGLVSLVGLARGAPAPPRRILSETFYPRTRFGWSPLASLADERWHYIEAPRPELYDLAADPGETRNRAAEKPEPIRPMRAELESLRSTFRAPEPVDEERVRQLASLGYVTVKPSRGAAPLPDPKDVIGSLDLLRDGMAALQAGRPADAARLLEKLLGANPKARDGWEVYAQALLALGRDDEACVAAEKMLPLSVAGETDVLLSVAYVALGAGRSGVAVRRAEEARALGDPSADEVLARAQLEAGELGKAEAAAGRLLAKGRSRTRALLVLARVAALRGELSRALSFADEARGPAGGTAAAEAAGVHFVRGDVLARLGRADEAGPELREEIRLFPLRVEARAALVALEAAAGRRASAVSAARDLAESVPGPRGPAAAIGALEAIGERAAANELRKKAAARFPGNPRFRSGGGA